MMVGNVAAKGHESHEPDGVAEGRKLDLSLPAF